MREVLTIKSKEHFLQQLDKLFQRGLERFAIRKNQKEKIGALTFDLTYRCNSRCIMCNLWKRCGVDSGSRKQELSLDEIKKVVSQSELLKELDMVFLGGGEPTLRSDLVDICNYFSEQYPAASLVVLTNLIDTARIISLVKDISGKSGTKNLIISSSLDGIGATHEIVRRKKGAFKNLLKTLKKLRTDFPEIPCRLNFTLTPKNYRDLLPAFRLAEEFGCWFGVQVVAQMENTETFYWKSEQAKIIEEQIDAILESLYDKYRKFFTLFRMEDVWTYPSILAELYFLKSVSKYIKKPARYFKYCFAGRRFAWVDPYGKLYACPVKRDLEFGELRNTAFDRLWLSERAGRIRKYINTQKCNCWISCPIVVAREVFRHALLEK